MKQKDRSLNQPDAVVFIQRNTTQARRFRRMVKQAAQTGTAVQIGADWYFVRTEGPVATDINWYRAALVFDASGAAGGGRDPLLSEEARADPVDDPSDRPAKVS